MSIGNNAIRITAAMISSVAALLSSTIIKSDLLPDQLDWLGIAGTVVAACMVVATWVVGDKLKNRSFRTVIAVALMITLGVVVWLRAARVSSVVTEGVSHRYLRGGSLTPEGIKAQVKCGSVSDEDLIACAGVDLVPALYGRSYSVAYYLYIGDYLGLLMSFVVLVSSFGPKSRA